VDSYAEVSPSGTGIKIFFLTDDEACQSRAKRWKRHVQYPKHHSQKKAWGIEMYLTGGRYFTVTGSVFRNRGVLKVVSIETLQKIKERMDRFEVAKENLPRLTEAMAALPNNDVSWEAWIRVGMALHNATLGSRAGFDLFVAFSQKSSKFDLLATEERWRHWIRNPADNLGADDIFGMAGMDDIADELGCKSLVLGMNERWGQLQIGSKSYILDMKPRSGLLHSIVQLGAWKDLMIGFSPVVGKKKEPLHLVWLQSRYRNQYAGIGMYPPGGPELPSRFYNLWHGWGVEPRVGTWDLFKEHLFHVVCRQNMDWYDYLIRFLASRFQFPGQKLGVSPVLIGAKGSGKTIVLDILKLVYGPYLVRVTQGRHLLGNFNAHLEYALILHSEEAFWAGDKKAEGVLKDLVTGNSMQIEQKGVDVREVPSLIDLVITSNPQWVVPASSDERRYFVLNVSDEKVGDYEYFRAMWEEMKAGGTGAMLNDLLEVDLSGWVWQDVPQTPALMEQKLLSQSSFEAFVLQSAQEGWISGMDDAFSVEKEHFAMSYRQFVMNNHMGRPWSSIQIGKYLVSVGVNVGYRPDNRDRRRYKFPALQAFREIIDVRMKQRLQWDEDREAWLVSGGNIDF
jgi:hypothetical protein